MSRSEGAPSDCKCLTLPQGLFRLAKALLGRHEAGRALEVLETMKDLALSDEDKEVVEKLKAKGQKQMK